MELHKALKEIVASNGPGMINNIQIKDALPTQEQLQERMRLLQKGLQEAKRLMKKQ